MRDLARRDARPEDGFHLSAQILRFRAPEILLSIRRCIAEYLDTNGIPTSRIALWQHRGAHPVQGDGRLVPADLRAVPQNVGGAISYHRRKDRNAVFVHGLHVEKALLGRITMLL